jgi:hypothetical protein
MRFKTKAEWAHRSSPGRKRKTGARINIRMKRKFPLAPFSLAAWRWLTVLAAASMLAGCGPASCDLCGRWRSQDSRTVAEMERSTKLTERRRAFYRDGFFGRLTVETRDGMTRAWFDEEDPDDVPWEPLVAERLSPGVWSVTADVQDRKVTRRIRIEGNCYVVEQPELGFGEWFCRTE